MSLAALDTTIPHNGAMATVQTLAERVAALEAQLAEVQSRLPKDKVTIVVFSGDLDRVLAAFIIASGAATIGQDVSMFFTFWGLNALRRQRKLRGKKLTEKLMALMTPADTKGMGVSKLNFFGVGALMLRQMMKEKNVTSVEELIDLCADLGVRMVSCEMSRDVMGIDPDELRPNAEVGGVAAYLADALESRVTLFI
ncbi:MAG: DsrE/DsrF/DrsH-like family protein [Anaerolineae bacterium]|nr:DsrE/DsrF/DrsH-like family protein [Caldilineales bacterium]MCX7853510.1 DsrE/DsrF/DrsH-like family protein [Caldilineales bacterium]MDW8269724.1 DsrE/DsrF/DrsH-like family protein [Anaerolineae bacterium]